MFPNIDHRIAAMRAGLARKPVRLRLRMFGGLLALTGADRVGSEAELATGQRPFARNFVTDAIFGKREPGVRVTDDRFCGEAGDLTLRIYRSAHQRPRAAAILYMHGGGWVSGAVGMTDWWCSKFAARTGSLVASLDYRLAPRHRFPAALEDGFVALRWLRDRATDLGIDPEGIGVAGDSAGGNLAAALCLYTRDKAGPPIAGQTLINPPLDLTFASPSVTENATAPFLSAAAIEAYARLYLGPSVSPGEPYASPLLSGDLSSLPPALIQVGEHDPLRDDGWRYALGLSEAGVPVRITEYAGAPHGFALFPGLTRLAGQALDDAVSHHLSPTFAHFDSHGDQPPERLA